VSATRERRIDQYREARDAYIATPYGAYATAQRHRHNDALDDFAFCVRVVRIEGIDERDIDADDGVTFLLPTVPRPEQAA